MGYFKILESFLLATLFSKNEYNANSKEFKPLKILVTIILVLNLFLTVYMFIHLSEVYVKVAKTCPAVLVEKN